MKEKRARAARIREKFDGCNIDELAGEHGLTKRMIRYIVYGK